jgi:hypothetical protein
MPIERNPQASEFKRLQEKCNESSWDEGVIHEFMKSGGQLRVWEMGAHHLLFYADREDLEEGKDIADELQRLLAWLEPPRPFTVYLWWRDDPRQLSANAWPTKREVNGGWTNTGSSEICVYRKEEWDRVVLHEMIHALEWDWTMPHKPLPCWDMEEGSKTTPALFEAWTELLAEWLWCGWHGVSWKEQRVWQDDQAVQLLARIGEEPWREDTNVFAYYVLKAALAPHMAFLWIYGNGQTVAEREKWMCRLPAEPLRRLRKKVAQTRPRSISLCMTKK